MVEKYTGGVVEAPDSTHDGTVLAGVDSDVLKSYRQAMDSYDLSDGISTVWRLIRASDTYVEENAPWELAKDNNESEKLRSVLYHLIESLRHITILASPVIPGKSKAMWEQLSLSGILQDSGLGSLEEWGGYPSGNKIKKGESLFPRFG